jgi:F-type H+-transporting ATPase subunit gamma
MASLKEIRIRIESTKNTQQITKAMKLVSAAKLRKAQHQITNMRPYAQSLLKIISNVAATKRVSHPLMTPHETVKSILLLVVSSDRGLCGGFNSNINKFTDQFLKSAKDNYGTIDILFIGKKSSEFFARRKVSGIETITRLDKDISYDLASKIAERAMTHYLSGKYDEVKLIYNEFKSAISQKVTLETLLPVDISKQTLTDDERGAPTFSADMIFEPNPEKIIEDLLNKHFSVQVFRCMAESVAAEHGARMTAMENATNNARDVLNKLTLHYNKARQEKITTELIEIVSGAEAL